MNESSNYIAFLDLLGIKSIAQFDYESYFDCVMEFQNALEACLKNNIQKKRSTVDVYVFSDCAYFESSQFDSLCLLLRNLRFQLLTKGVFFNAAVTTGTLGHKFVNSYSMSGSVFENKDTVRVCTMQNSFSGAGIKIDDDVASKNEDETIVSCFCRWDEKSGTYSNFTPCYDVMYGSNALSNLRLVVLNFIKTAYIDKRAARYYFTAMKTCVFQMDRTNVQEFVSILKDYKMQDMIIQCITPLYYILVDRIYTIAAEREKKDEEGFDSLFDYRNMQRGIRELLDELTLLFYPKGLTTNINTVSDALITSEHKYLLSKYALIYNMNGN